MPASWLTAGCAALTVSAAMALRHTSQGMEAQGSESPGYYWPHARGNVGSYSLTEHTAPANLTAALSWSWHHPDGQYGTIVTSAPLIDDQKNLYIAGEDGVRKFSVDGKELWHYRPKEENITTCPSLMSGSLFGNTANGTVFALDMDTGKVIWAKKKAPNAPNDTGYVEAHDGVVVTGLEAFRGGGALSVLGLDAKNGSWLWEYQPGVPMWNIMPLFPGDDTWVAMDLHGGVHKVSLSNGTLIWRAHPPARSEGSFSKGGVILGPDGTAYACSNLDGYGEQGQRGALRAYAAKDGKLLWDRSLEYPCHSWPVVSKDGHSVIVPTGALVASPASSNVRLRAKVGKGPEQMHSWSMSLGAKEVVILGMPEKTAAVRAFDALTGEPKWSVELPPYGRLAARGDEEGYLFRKARQARDQCLPAQFGAPTLSGDGKVYVGRADGLLYAVDGSAGTYQTFDALAGFLHPGTSWAPGLMAVTTCDGLFVWKY